MNVFIIQLFHRSCSMALVVLLYALAALILTKRYSAKSFYYAGVLILLGFLIPFRPSISIPVPIEHRTAGLSLGSVFLQDVIATPEKSLVQHGISTAAAKNIEFSSFGIAFLVWLFGVFIVLLYHGIQHIRFIKTVNRWSTVIEQQTILNIFHESGNQFGITACPGLFRCACISSPMLVQLFHPVLLLPDIPFSAEELKLILKHEMIHFKRKDLIYKGMIILAVAVNWFNPAVYLFAKLFSHFCELSCDEIVTENMNENDRYKYAAVVISMAYKKLIPKTAFSTFFNGSKENMKIRISSIMCSSKKPFGFLLLTICSILILSTGTVFAASENSGNSINLSGDQQSYFYDIKTADEIELEIEKSFSEKFSNTFDEANFPGMIITYDETGIPIVTDPNNVPIPRTVTATTRYAKNGFYSSSDCSSSSLVFYILKDQTVEVVDSSYTATAAKVVYAGSTGYIRKSDLNF